MKTGRNQYIFHSQSMSGEKVKEIIRYFIATFPCHLSDFDEALH